MDVSFEVRIGHGANSTGTCVVDKDVDPAEAIDGSRNKSIDGLWGRNMDVEVRYFISWSATFTGGRSVT
jgi:hypothetical protein